MYKKLFANDRGFQCYNCHAAYPKSHPTLSDAPTSSLIFCETCGEWTENYLRKSAREAMYNSILVGTYSTGTLTTKFLETLVIPERKPLTVCFQCHKIASSSYATFIVCQESGNKYCSRCIFKCPSCQFFFGKNNANTSCCGTRFCPRCKGTHMREYHYLSFVEQ